MKISVITTTYNCENYIDDTIESVLNQKGDFYLEYIVIDAMSSDSTWEKIKKYKQLVDSGFYNGRTLGITMIIKSEKDGGMYEGISKGLKIATGDIISYINGDDMYFHNAFSTVNEIFSQFTNVKWITGNPCSYNTKGQIISVVKNYTYFKHLILKGVYGLNIYFIQQESCFWRRELCDEIDIEKWKSYKLAGDYFLWHTFAKNNDLYLVDTCLGGFRVVPNQKSSDINKYKLEMKAIADSDSLQISEKLLIKVLRKLSKNDLFVLNVNKISYNFEQGCWKLQKYENNIRSIFEYFFFTFLLFILNARVNYKYLHNGMSNK